MKTKISFILAVVMCVSACSTTSKSQNSTSKYDNEKMYLVNQAAKQKGVKVIWVNPPRKQKDKN